MNEKRESLVAQAYKKLDKDRSGTVDINDLKGVYDASHHPDVKSGKKTPDDILMEFLDTFEMHASLSNSSGRDGVITFDEFKE
jgi:Ca2+-binding EF-hand superfamily protein